LSDSDISGMTPEEAHRILLTPDENAIRNFLETFVALAIKSLGGHPAPGLLATCCKDPDGDLIPARHQITGVNVVNNIACEAMVASDAGLNCYIEGRLVKRGLRRKGRGGLADTACVFALCVDSDADKNRAWTPPAGVRPTLTVETSPGNHQFWFFFDRAVSPACAQRLGEGRRQATGCDTDTGNPMQPYRIPGTVNYPNKGKVANGRVVTPTLFLGATA
jgi:hypothetical protein